MWEGACGEGIWHSAAYLPASLQSDTGVARREPRREDDGRVFDRVVQLVCFVLGRDVRHAEALASLEWC